jgi:hypothetical protein
MMHYIMALLPPRAHRVYIRRVIIDVLLFSNGAVLFLERVAEGSFRTAKMSIYIYGSLQKYEMQRKFYARMYQIYFLQQVGDVELGGST